MVTKQDWFSINNIILTMSSTVDDIEMMQNVLSAIRVLVPFDVGLYLSEEATNEDITVNTSVIVGADKEFVSEYCQYATSSDYALPLMNMHNSIAYKDTDLLDEAKRKNTDFYKKFLQKYKVPYVGGIICVLNGKLLGEITLFRSEKLGDFTDQELDVLNTLKPHFNNRLYYKLSVRESTALPSKLIFKKCKDSKLTQKEMEVVDLLIAGNGYDDISESLFISINTVKKHTSNIFKKLDVSNRMELIKYFVND